ncbi:MAG: hypothetical protein P8179_01265 [Candidatus Thiodiazotropha sp.]
MRSALVAAHGGVATPWNSGLFRVVIIWMKVVSEKRLPVLQFAAFWMM